MERLDIKSLKAVELKAPGACEETRDNLHGYILSGRYFSCFSEEERAGIWIRLCATTTDCLVPSFYGFFENRKYLEAAAGCMKILLTIGPRNHKNGIPISGTIYTTLKESLTSSQLRSQRCLIQVDESSFKFVPVSDETDHFDVLQRALWLFAFREYPYMPGKKKNKLAGPEVGVANENVVYRFAKLALQLGFDCQEIRALIQRDPEREMTRRFLSEIRDPGLYIYDDIDNVISQIVSAVSTARSTGDRKHADEMEISQPLRHCGKPSVFGQQRTKRLLFLDKLHTTIDRPFSSSLTSFFVERSVYFSYFRKEISVNIDIVSSLPICNLTQEINQTALEDDILMEDTEQQVEDTCLGQAGKSPLCQRTHSEARIHPLQQCKQDLSTRIEDLSNEDASRQDAAAGLVRYEQQQKREVPHNNLITGPIALADARVGYPPSLHITETEEDGPAVDQDKQRATRIDFSVLNFGQATDFFTGLNPTSTSARGTSEDGFTAPSQQNLIDLVCNSRTIKNRH